MQDMKDYQKEKLTIDLVKANVYSLLLIIPIGLIYGLPYYLIWHPKFDFKNFVSQLNLTDTIWGGFLSVVLLLGGIVAHELIHGLTWSLFTKKGFKSIKFGILWEMLTPYCHCQEPLKVKHYILGAITPSIVLGLIPALLAIIMGNGGMLLFGMIFTLVASGDFLIINLVRKENMNDLVLDHPTEAGCYVYRKQ